jgi:tetratricopeptide (TPR) repeat protein
MSDSPRIEELKRRVQSDPASIAFAALAEEYRRAGRFEEAIAACTAGLVRHPAYLSAHVTLGRALLEVGRFEDAREELEHVLRLAPENLAAIRGLAEIHHRRGDDAHEHYSDADVARYAAEGDAAHAAEAALEHAAAHAARSASEVVPPRATEPDTAPPYDPYGVAAAEPVAAPAHVPVPVAHAESPVERVVAAKAPAAADPALAGLEHFLHAIVRARTGDAAR